MKGIECCGQCADYSYKLHKCMRGFSQGVASDSFYTDCDLPEAEPVKQWYSVEENQPDSVGDDVLVVDSYGKYHIAYYLSGSENWMNQDTRKPIKDVVKWRYLGGDSE